MCLINKLLTCTTVYFTPEGTLTVYHQVDNLIPSSHCLRDKSVEFSRVDDVNWTINCESLPFSAAAVCSQSGRSRSTTSRQAKSKMFVLIGGGDGR